jgi:hypothetical protein
VSPDKKNVAGRKRSLTVDTGKNGTDKKFLFGAGWSKIVQNERWPQTVEPAVIESTVYNLAYARKGRRVG